MFRASSGKHEKEIERPAIDPEDILREIERDNVTESSKIEGIKKIEASKANGAQRARAAVVAHQIWEKRKGANSSMFDVSHWRSDIVSARPLLEIALRLDPNNRDYQHEWEHCFTA